MAYGLLVFFDELVPTLRAERKTARSRRGSLRSRENRHYESAHLAIESLFATSREGQFMGSFLCSRISTFEGKNLTVRSGLMHKLVRGRCRINLVEEGEGLVESVILGGLDDHMKRSGLDIDNDAVLGNALETYDLIACLAPFTDERHNNILSRLVVVVVILLGRHDNE